MAKIAWHSTRKLKKYTDDVNKLKFTLLDSLVCSVLLYGLHLIPIQNAEAAKLHSFLLRTYKVDTTNQYTELDQKPPIDRTLGDSRNIPTDERKIKYPRYKMYENCENSISIAYLNSVTFINEQLNYINNDMSSLKNTSSLSLVVEIFSHLSLIAPSTNP